MVGTDPANVSRAGRGLSWLKLLGLILVFILGPQFVSLFAFGVSTLEEGYSTLRGAIAAELVPDLGGAVIAAAVAIWLGWGRLVLRDRVPTRRWVWIVPVSIIGVSLIAVDWARLGEVGASLTLALLTATFFTGLSEELMFRGIALQMMRQRYSELAAGIVSSLLFGVTHLLNALVFGAGAIPQAMLAGAIGYLLYLSRRVSGGILVPIVVHWLYDFSTFSGQVGTEPESSLSDAGLALILLQIVLFVVVVVAHRAIEPPREPIEPALGT